MSDRQKNQLADATPTRIKAGIRRDGDIAVLRPTSTKEISDILRKAGLEGRRVAVRGEASNVVGCFDGHQGVTLSTELLTEPFEIDEQSQTVRVGAGINGGKVEKRLNEVGFTLGQFPQSLYISTIGGWFSTRASGSHSTGNGGFEDVVRGGTVVLGSGEILRFPARARPVGGVDGLAALIGSEGSLCVVTELTVDIMRQFPSRRLCYLFEDFAGNICAQRELVQGGHAPSLLRGYNGEETEHICGDVGDACLLLATIEGPEPLQSAREGAARNLLQSLGGRRIDNGAADKWFAHRYRVETIMLDGNATAGECFDTVEVSLPWGEAARCAHALEQTLGSMTSRLYLHFSHAYNCGACLYALMWIDADGDDARARERLRECWRLALDIVDSHKGAVGHHHGIGMMRADRYAGTADARIHLGMKSAFDPDGVLHARLLNL